MIVDFIEHAVLGWLQKEVSENHHNTRLRVLTNTPTGTFTYRKPPLKKNVTFCRY